MKLHNPKIHNPNFRAAKISSGFGVFLFVFCTAILPSAICGKTLAKYRADVKNAKILVQALIYTDDDEEMSPAEYAEYKRATLAEIRAEMPAIEKIEWQGTSVETNNKWLTDDLNEFEKEPPDSPRREAILTEASERLEAIGQKLNETENPSASNRAKDEDKQKLAEILRREEYTKPEEPKESLFQQWWREFKEWLAKMFPHPDIPAPQAPSGFQSLSFILQMLLYALVLGAIGFLIYRFAPFLAQKFKTKEKREKRERVILGERLADDETAQNLFDEAERLASEGNLRGAIRKGYIAVLCELADRKIIGLARHKTNRDYLRDVRRERTIYENMNGLTANFERHWYGSDSVEEKDWNEFKNGYKRVITR
ncbi:MAG: DUF4129 domain-containing protein [Acidobacteriota bacterium]|nr:DUF4129 domain-containing protein [Acidobacteriota bacterium]